MEINIVNKPKPAALHALDDLLLDEEGRLRALPAKKLIKIPQTLLSTWCQTRGRYTVPSLELVEWLRQVIDGREALEIGAGAGDLGHLLGIRMTDSFLQVDHPEMMVRFRSLGLSPLAPAADVERLEALAAVEKYKPKVVIAAWVTQLYLPGDENPPPINSSIYGVNELELLEQVEGYVHIGHAKVHGDKRLLRRPHEKHEFPFIFARQLERKGNVVWMWNRRKR